MSQRLPSSPGRLPEHDLIRVLAEAGTLEEAVPRLLELIAEAFDWSLGALWLVDEESALLHWRDGWHRADPALEEFTRVNRRLTFARGAGVAGTVWASGEPAWIGDLTDRGDFPRRDLVERAGLVAVVVQPVVGPAGVLGVMEFFSRSQRDPDPVQLDVMRTVGRQIGQYIARVRAEERLAATEERSDAIVAAALDCVVTMDHEGVIVDFNPAAEATFGYSRDEAVGRELAELLIPPELRAAHRHALSRYVETDVPSILGRRIELEGLRADGTRIPVELTVARVGNRRPPVFAGFLRDITERMRTREELGRLLEREHEARLAAEAAERGARRVAVALQRSLLPPHLPAIAGIELGAAYRAGSESSSVGGDFYDVFELGDGRWGVAIGDVRGKGPDAASVTALVRYSIRAAAVREHQCSAVLRVVNDALLHTEPGDDFCTALFARLDVAGDRPRMRIAIGGHPQPLLLTAAGEVTEIGATGTLLGAVEHPVLRDVELELAPGDTLVLYTDGVTEARTPEGMFGERRLAELLAGSAGLDAGAIVRRIEEAVADTADHSAVDDVAVLVIRATA